MTGSGGASNADLSARIEELEQASVVDHEIIAHLEAEGVLDRTKIANMEIALITCRRIGAAIGVLMATRLVSDVDAFEMLRKASQHSHRKLRDVAEDVLFTGALAGPDESDDTRT